MDVVSSGLKRKNTIQIVTSTKFKRQHLWCCGVLVPVAWETCTSVTAVSFAITGFFQSLCPFRSVFPMRLKNVFNDWKLNMLSNHGPKMKLLPDS